MGMKDTSYPNLFDSLFFFVQQYDRIIQVHATSCSLFFFFKKDHSNEGGSGLFVRHSCGKTKMVVANVVGVSELF